MRLLLALFLVACQPGIPDDTHADPDSDSDSDPDTDTDSDTVDLDFDDDGWNDDGYDDDGYEPLALDEEGGGCQAAPGQGGPVGALGLLVGLALLRRRRQLR